MNFKRFRQLGVFWLGLTLGTLLLGFGNAHAGSYDDFFIAVRNDNPSVVRDLLQRGFDPNTRNPTGDLGLIIAFQEESPKVAKLLMAHPDVEVNALNAAGESALMMAALKGNLMGMTALLERGARVNQPGWSAIHYAATGPEVRAVRMLLDLGADINAASPNGSTPLMMAAQYGTQASAELLLERGADRARRNDKNLLAADFASHAGRDALARKLEPFGR